MISVFVLLIALTSVIAFNPIDYTNNTQLDPNYQLYWKTDQDWIYLAIKAGTEGWVGFGIGEYTSGAMPGADIVTGYIDATGIHIQDRHGLGFYEPPVDDCQDWILVAGEQTTGQTIIEVKRKLMVTDNSDRNITAGVNKIIWAYGQTDDVQYHGGSSRGLGGIMFYGVDNRVDIKTLLNDKSTQTFDFLAPSYVIPNVPTTYNHINITIPFNYDVHIIGIEYVLDPLSSKYVHHFTLYGYYNLSDLSNKMMLWAWAPGIDNLVLPSVAGFKAGSGADSVKALVLETHYNNPNRDSGVVDRSGVRIYYTQKIRQYDAGVIQTGDPAVTQFNPIPKGTGFSEYEYDCPSGCTSKWTNLNIFSSFLHMHQQGTQMWSNIWRSGVKHELNRVDFYDFNIQQQTPMDYVLQPGDRISVHCVYKQDSSNSVIFGQASTDEMCIHYISYYPRIAGDGFCMYFGLGAGVGNVTYCNNDIAANTNPTQYDPAGGRVVKFASANPNGYTCATPQNEILFTGVSQKTSQSAGGSSAVGGSSNVQSSVQGSSAAGGSSNVQSSETSQHSSGNVVILFSLLLIISVLF